MKRGKVRGSFSQLRMSSANETDEKHSLIVSCRKSRELINKRTVFWQICNAWFLIIINNN